MWWPCGLKLPDYRCEEEDVTLTEKALGILTRLAAETTLRYVLNLISCAQMIAKKRKAESVDDVDIRRAYVYFFDEKRSVQWIKEQQHRLVSEEGVDFNVNSLPATKPVASEIMDES